jgi:putative ABC transport system permease protein
VGLSNASLRLAGENVTISATDPQRFAAVGDLGVVAGSLEGMSRNGLAVGQKEAAEHGWALGSDVPVEFADGTSTTATVEAIYTQQNIVGPYVLNDALWAPHRGRDGDFVVLVDLRDGIGLADGKAAVQTVVDQSHGPEVLDRQGFSDANAEEIDQFLGLVYGLLGLAVLIALLGIANTLSLGIHERRRELGLLRALGQSKRDVRSTVRWESVIVALFGTAGGVVLGTFLGWGLVRALVAQEGFGVFAMPVPTLAVVLALAAAAGVVAAIRPARRAARLDILRAIATA